VEVLRHEIKSGYETKQKHAEEWNKLYENLVEVCFILENHAEALEYVERSKARNLVELLAFRNIDSIDSSDSLVQPIHYREITALLDDKTAIIEWYILGGKFLVFIVTREIQTPFVWQSSASDLQALQNWSNEYLSTYQNQEQKNQWSEQLQPRLVQLAEILHIDEILFHIPAICTQLILIPHRYLHLFPLHALPISMRGQEYCLLNRFPNGVQYAPSCQVLKLLETRQRPYFRHLFAVQNPNEDLDYTDLEVEIIRSYFAKTTILAKKQGTKSALNDALELNDTNCLHISTHSFFDFSSPLYSALFLAKNIKGTNSGSQEEIAALISLLQTTEDEFSSLQAAERLGEIGVGHEMAIAALAELLATSQSESTRRRAAESLQKIDPGNEAIAALVQFQITRTEDTHRNAYVPVPSSFQPEPKPNRRANINLEQCLNLAEIYNLNLSQCRLVTLSASETALTDFSSTSDEYIGFPGAFLHAGATNVIGSLWNINDMSTAFMMIKFYDNLFQGVSVAVALNQAQLWLKNSTVEELLEWVNQFKNFNATVNIQLRRQFRKGKTEKPFANPYYWAAFTVVGKLEKSMVKLVELGNNEFPTA
jgi:CHAT domain-containing protein